MTFTVGVAQHLGLPDALHRGRPPPGTPGLAAAAVHAGEHGPADPAPLDGS